MREHDVYKTDVRQAAEEIAGRILLDGPVPPNSTDLERVHYTFDYSQNVLLPHHAMQMGPLYFIAGRKAHIFGIRHDTTGKQYNYLIDEDQSIGMY